MLGSLQLFPKAVLSVHLSERLTWPTVILFGILGQLSAHSKAVSIFRHCYFLILFYMKLIPFDTYLAFFYIVLFSFGVIPWQKIFYVLYLFSPLWYSFQPLQTIFLFLCILLKQSHIQFQLIPFLLSLLQSFNFVYSYVPLCLWVFSLLNLWLLFAVRHFVTVFATGCHAMYYPLGHNVNVQKEFFSLSSSFISSSHFLLPNT